MPYENHKEYQEMMADEAKQAAADDAKEPDKNYTHRKVAGGTEVWNPYTGYEFYSDYDGE